MFSYTSHVPNIEVSELDCLTISSSSPASEGFSLATVMDPILLATIEASPLLPPRQWNPGILPGPFYAIPIHMTSTWEADGGEGQGGGDEKNLLLRGLNSLCRIPWLACASERGPMTEVHQTQMFKALFILLADLQSPGWVIDPPGRSPSELILPIWSMRIQTVPRFEK